MACLVMLAELSLRPISRSSTAVRCLNLGCSRFPRPTCPALHIAGNVSETPGPFTGRRACGNRKYQNRLRGPEDLVRSGPRPETLECALRRQKSWRQPDDRDSHTTAGAKLRAFLGKPFADGRISMRIMEAVLVRNKPVLSLCLSLSGLRRLSGRTVGGRHPGKADFSRARCGGSSCRRCHPGWYRL